MLRSTFAVVLAVAIMVTGITPVAATNADIGTEPQQLTNGSCAFPVTATDATGSEVTVENEPQQVVALGPSTAQTLWEIGAKEKVTGMPVNQYTAYLNDTTNRTDVMQADDYTVAVEEVVGLDPDLVLAPNIIPNETIETLRGAGLTVYKFDIARSLADINEKTNRTGQLVGACEGAAETVSNTQERINAIDQAVGDEERPRVFYPQSGGFAPGNGTFIHTVMETAGGDNIAANAGIEGYRQISNETIAERNPEWIITSNVTTIPTGEPYASTTAIEQNQTIVVNPNLISQPGPRIVVPMTKIAHQLHPQAMQEANLTTTAATEQSTSNNSQATNSPNESGATVVTDGGTTEEIAAQSTAVETTNSPGLSSAATARESADATEINSSTETTTGSGPGFTVFVAIVALLGGGLLVARQR
jgi:iron complex transport system substrate-binding protein